MSNGISRQNQQYLNRYEPGDQGVRFMPGATFSYGQLPPLPDGILGDRVLRENLKTDLLKKPLTIDDIRRPAFTIDELNDLTAY